MGSHATGLKEQNNYSPSCATSPLDVKDDRFVSSAAYLYSGEIPFLSAFEHNGLPGCLFQLCRNSVFDAGIGSSRQSSNHVLKPAIEPLMWFPFPQYMTNA
jgi:hypothetical protein